MAIKFTQKVENRWVERSSTPLTLRSTSEKRTLNSLCVVWIQYRIPKY